MAELSQAALEEMVEGKPQKPRAVFYEKAQLQVAASKDAGKRLYKTRTYVKFSQAGVTDNISYTAKRADIESYPEEYEYFLRNKQNSTSAVSIDIIPSINISHRQELVDMGLSTIDRLADAQSVPPHLEYVRISAKAFQSVIKEQQNASIKEESHEESHEEINTTEAVLATHRSRNGSDVRQSSIQDSGRRGEVDSSKGLYQARQVNSGKSVTPLVDVNWSISF